MKMKTANCILGKTALVIVLFIFVFSSVTSGNGTAATGDSFSITSAESSVNLSVWNLKYAESERGFQITMVENNGEKEYIVRSKFFEVAYILNKNGFGARMVKGSKTQVPVQIVEKIINREALNNQKVISDANISNEVALNLIASYLPDLINNSYKHLLQ